MTFATDQNGSKEAPFESVADVLGPYYNPHYHPDLAARVAMLLQERNSLRNRPSKSQVESLSEQQWYHTMSATDGEVTSGEQPFDLIAVEDSSEDVKSSQLVDGMGTEEGTSQEWGTDEINWHAGLMRSDTQLSPTPVRQLVLDHTFARQGMVLATILGPPRALAPYAWHHRV